MTQMDQSLAELTMALSTQQHVLIPPAHRKLIQEVRVTVRKNGGNSEEWTDEDIYERLKRSEPPLTPLLVALDILDAPTSPGQWQSVKGNKRKTESTEQKRPPRSERGRGPRASPAPSAAPSSAPASAPSSGAAKTATQRSSHSAAETSAPQTQPQPHSDSSRGRGARGGRGGARSVGRSEERAPRGARHNGHAPGQGEGQRREVKKEEPAPAPAVPVLTGWADKVKGTSKPAKPATTSASMPTPAATTDSNTNANTNTQVDKVPADTNGQKRGQRKERAPVTDAMDAPAPVSSEDAAPKVAPNSAWKVKNSAVHKGEAPAPAPAAPAPAPSAPAAQSEAPKPAPTSDEVTPSPSPIATSATAPAPVAEESEPVPAPSPAPAPDSSAEPPAPPRARQGLVVNLPATLHLDDDDDFDVGFGGPAVPRVAPPAPAPTTSTPTSETVAASSATPTAPVPVAAPTPAPAPAPESRPSPAPAPAAAPRTAANTAHSGAAPNAPLARGPAALSPLPPYGGYPYGFPPMPPMGYPAFDGQDASFYEGFGQAMPFSSASHEHNADDANKDAKSQTAGPGAHSAPSAAQPHAPEWEERSNTVPQAMGLGLGIGMGLGMAPYGAPMSMPPQFGGGLYGYPPYGYPAPTQFGGFAAPNPAGPRPHASQHHGPAHLGQHQHPLQHAPHHAQTPIPPPMGFAPQFLPFNTKFPPPANFDDDAALGYGFQESAHLPSQQQSQAKQGHLSSQQQLHANDLQRQSALFSQQQQQPQQQSQSQAPQQQQTQQQTQQQQHQQQQQEYGGAYLPQGAQGFFNAPVPFPFPGGFGSMQPAAPSAPNARQ